MNIGSINNSPYSFYNSSSRINSSRVNETTSEVKVKDAARQKETASDSKGSSAIYQRDDYSGPQRTEVSTDNLYQKTMLSDSHFKMERLASKLFDKLPQIFSDMRNVSDTPDESTSSTANNSKVVISENSPSDYLERQAQNAALQDISLS